MLLEPLDVNAIEPRTPVLGCPVKLTVDPDRLYDFAEMEPGNTLSLRNAPAGSARVPWLEESGSTERWAVVRLGDAEDVRAEVAAIILDRQPLSFATELAVVAENC